MRISSIFVDESTSKLWSVCYPEDAVGGVDERIFDKLFDQWRDTEFVRNYLKANSKDLADKLGQGLSINRGIDKVNFERTIFESELCAIDIPMEGFKPRKIEDIFKRLHQNDFVLNSFRDNQRKGKPSNWNPILRIYAIVLSDETIIVTGGEIKVKRTTDPREKAKLDKVQKFLDANSITDHQSLIEYISENE